MLILRSGIYKITSPSGKCYIGSALNFSKRWYMHLNVLRKGKHHSPILQNPLRKQHQRIEEGRILLRCARK